jgi:serine-type D-Ala-D-Ala carboxypeptidase/endopeptidase (penicillin-binding protein 4)
MVSRRGVLIGLAGLAANSGLADVVFADAPLISPNPPARPSGGRVGTAPDLDAILTGLSGTVAFVVADARTGEVLESRQPNQLMPPASVTKALTTLFALERLGAGFRFRTQVLAAGTVANERLNGDLILVGGGDPTLDTDALAELAKQVRDAGISQVTGKYLYYSAGLPQLTQIDAEQADYLGYNPAISGLNLNFNRVYFEWKKQGAEFVTSMDARSDHYQPTISTASISIVDRDLPIFTYKDEPDVERWTVARSALNKAGSRWLPVRHPDRYTAEVFRYFALSHGISLDPAIATNQLPQGAVLAQRFSQPLPDLAKDMLEFSTNLTAEILGLYASGGASLAASASAMTAFLKQSYGVKQAHFVDHSGLGDGSRISAADMVSALVQDGPDGKLLPLLKHVEINDAKGKPMENSPFKVVAKTGTLNFVSALAGYETLPSGRALAFAIFAGDMDKRAKSVGSNEEQPQGARTWNRKAKAAQSGLLDRWGKLFA